MHQLPIPDRHIVITGNLMPWRLDCEQPVLVFIEQIPFLPIFTTEARLRQTMQDIGISDYKIKQIEDGREFLESVIDQIRIASDPWITDRGTTRFTEVKR